MPIPSEMGFNNSAPKIYTSTSAGGVLVLETPVASNPGGDSGQSKSNILTETVAAAGITVPVRQVLSEWNEAGVFGSLNTGNPSAGQQEGTNTEVVVASVSASGDAGPSNTNNPFLNSPWSQKTIV